MCTRERDIPVIGCLRESNRRCIVSGDDCLRLSKKFDLVFKWPGAVVMNRKLSSCWSLDEPSVMSLGGEKAKFILDS